MKTSKILVTSIVVLTAVLASAAWQKDQDVPRFHSSAPAKGEKLAPILTPEQIKAQGFMLPQQVKAYELAAKVPSTLYQLPCYCHCDRSAGHQSLRSCFESTHGARCSTCMQEAIFAYQQHKAGKTAREIREAIERGDYEKVDLDKVSALE
ncbi:MAG: hypothetical protein JO041_10600 [Acidobacteria bacterium]|nr:hypothetical protein [Acidobacteriota bacterium]